MTVEKALYIAKNRAKSIVLIGMLVGALSFLFLVTTQANFKSSSDLLVVQNQNGFSDYYALSKSADYLSSILVESIYSEKFLDEVQNINPAVTGILPTDQKDRLEKWSKIVKVGKTSNLGLLHIEVFGDTQKQVSDTSEAILTVLTTKNFSFLGRGQDLDIRVMSGPIAEKNPTLGEIALSIVGGIIIGMLISFMWNYYSEELKSRKYLAQIQKNETQDYLESLNYLK